MPRQVRRRDFPPAGKLDVFSNCLPQLLGKRLPQVLWKRLPQILPKCSLRIDEVSPETSDALGGK
jgi:hypothetical protein